MDPQVMDKLSKQLAVDRMAYGFSFNPNDNIKNIRIKDKKI